MNTRKLLVSVLMLVCVLFSACAPAVTPLPVVAPTNTTMPATVTPESVTSDPKALALIAGSYVYKDGKESFPFNLFSSNESFISLIRNSIGPLVAYGAISVTADQITFVEGSGLCKSQLGIYKWFFENNILHLTLIKDECKRRADIFGTQAFEKAPTTSMTATVVWEFPATVNGIATDSLGNVYINDGGASFFKYDTNGKLLGSWNKGLSDTTGISVDGNGNIYVANFDPPEIHKFSPDGNPLLTWTIADGVGPVGLAVDPQGNVYVALHRIHDHYIEKYDPQGKLLGTWAKPDTAGGQIKAGPRSGPSFMAVAINGDNYIQDNEQAHKYDKDGNFLYSIPKHCSVAADSQSNLYLFVSEDSTILKFDSNGKQIGKWSAPIPGIHPGYSYGIAIDNDGNIFLYSDAVLAKIKLPAR